MLCYYNYEYDSSRSIKSLLDLPDLVLDKITRFLDRSSLYHFSLTSSYCRKLSYRLLFKNLRIVDFNQEKDIIKSIDYILRFSKCESLVFFRKLDMFSLDIIRSNIQLKKLKFLKEIDYKFDSGELSCLFDHNQNIQSIEFQGGISHDNRELIQTIFNLHTCSNITTLKLGLIHLNLNITNLLFSELYIKHLQCIATTEFILPLMSTNKIKFLKSWEIPQIASNSVIQLVLCFEMATELTRLAMEYSSISYSPRYFEALSLHKKIIELKLADNDETPFEDLLEFMNCNPQLNSFSLQFHSLSDDMLSRILKGRNMSKLSFKNTYLTTLSLQNILMECPNLTELMINPGSIYKTGPRIDLELLEHSLALNVLKIFEVHVDHIIQKDIITLLPKMKSLERLNILTFCQHEYEIINFINILKDILSTFTNFNLLNLSLKFELPIQHNLSDYSNSSNSIIDPEFEFKIKIQKILIDLDLINSLVKSFPTLNILEVDATPEFPLIIYKNFPQIFINN